MNSRIALALVSCALSVLIGLVLARPGHTTVASPDRAPIIGFSLDTLKEERWRMDRDLFVQRAEALGARVEVRSADGSDTVQMQDAEGLITLGVDALVIVPHDGEVMAKAVRRAHASGIPVLAYDRLIKNADLDLYITFDNVRVGRLQAEFLLQTLRQRGPGPHPIVRIYGSKTDNNAFLFKQGQDEALADAIASQFVQVAHEDWADDWKRENAKRIMNAAISRIGPRFAAVLASNDSTAGGAIQALREEGLAGSILVTGQDAELAACQSIAAGEQSMTIYKPIRTLASRAAEAAVNLAQRRPLIARHGISNGFAEIPSILLDVQVVTRDTLESTVIADGYHPREAIFSQPEVPR